VARPAPSSQGASSQARKLGLRGGSRVALDHAPPGWSFADPPEGLVRVARGGQVDVLVSFFERARDLPGRLPKLTERTYPDGALWILWPRRAGGHDSDLTDEVVRAAALTLGVVDVKVAAVDEDWSGLQFRWRRELRGRR
jgi:hypothetical protein